MNKQVRKLSAMMLVLLLSITAAFSQVTTSTLSGRVISTTSEPLPGATVVAIHIPSGTQYGTITNVDGRFNIQGMRPGGPYKVDVSFIGYSTNSYSDVTLLLGEVFPLDVTLKESVVDVDEVMIVGSRAPAFNSEKNGASVNINNRQINTMPTISRSINDVTRLTPQANGNTIGGGNYRQNYITVDGAQFNNAFGIGTNLPGNGSPISLDALDQISVNITPFDVRQSGFIGASINAVTRSGGNEFTGSVYTYMQNEKYKGNKVGDNEPFTRSPASYEMIGARLGGPIIQNKLFFFANFETEKSQVPGPSRVAATASKPADYANNIARPTESELEAISKYLLDTYGYDTGPYQGYSFESPGRKFLARIDWNISQMHKFNIRYSYMMSKDPSNPSTSVSPFSSIYTGNRSAMDAMWFKNSGYFQERNFSSVSAELNSLLGGGKFANKLRFTYSFQDEPRSTDGKTFPFVDILKDNRVFTSFGTELFSYGNLREVKTFTITDDISWTWGIHNMTAGLQYEHNQTKNGFMRFGTSFYVFNSWEDFVGGAKPRNFGVTFSNTPGYAQAFPRFEFSQYTAYLQDEINISTRLKATAGFRVDLPTYSQPVDEHPIISTLTFGDKKYNTATLPKSRLLLSPRIGFNYDVNGDRSLIVRGGSGVFTGRVPFVWIVGQVGDAGMIQTTQTYSGNDVPGGFKPEVNAYYPSTQPAVGTIVPGTFTIIDNDFKLPQSWKSSLAVDARLPWDIKGTIEGIYNKDFNTAFFVNRGLKGEAPMNVSGYQDNRIIYPSANAAKYHQLHTSGSITTANGTGSGVSPIVLENEKGGYYYSITAKLEKDFSNGFSAMVAYTKSEAKNLVDGAGDQAASAWNGNANVNGANSPELSYASYVIPDKIIGSVSYRLEYLKHMATAVSLFYDGGAQGRFSYVYSSNIVRDGAGSNNLIYVPKDASEITFVNQTVNGVVWTAQEQSDAFFAYIDQDKYLKTRKGQYAERNGAILPWTNRYDVKVLQDFYVNVGGKRNTIQLSLDILNVGNLIDKNWGKAYLFNQNNILTPTNQNNVVAGGTVKPTYRLNPYNNQMLKETFRDNIGYASTYSMQFGIRYIFN
ncbi:MAG: TonB-dependent receptor [Bacteroidota bacterium]